MSDTITLDPRLAGAFSPARVAVVGAAEDRNKVGGRPIHYLKRFGFRGEIYPVNPRRETVQGLRAYPCLQALPAVPEVAVVAVSAQNATEVIEQCGRQGIGTAVMMSSGFGETGPQGMASQRALAERARSLGVRLVGPNAQGIANFATGAVLNFSTMFMEMAPQDGPVAIVSQSGAASVMPYAMLRERGIGVRYLVASGNDADAGACELALVAASDPHIAVVLLYLESLPEPAMLAEVSRRARARGASVIALKAGRSARGAQAAASHTGALVSDDAAIDAFLQRHGIWRARDIHGLVNAVSLYLAKPPRPAGELVVMSHSGAVGVLCADTAQDLGLPLAELGQATQAALAEVMPAFGAAQNPVDLTAALLTQGNMFARTLDVLAADPRADLFLIGVPVAGEGYDLPGMAEAAARFARRHDKPTAVSAPQAAVRDSFAKQGLPVFAHEGDALAALAQWRGHGRLLRDAARRDALPAGSAPAFALPAPGPGGWLDEAQSLALLAQAGIPVAAHRLCRTQAEAESAWEALEGRAVLKACSASIPHKSEHGLVFLDVASRQDVARAWQTCRQRVAALDVPFTGMLVAQRVDARREFALGVRMAPGIGPVVMVSDGGKYVEALKDFAVLLPPFDEQDVLLQLARLRMAPVFGGVRGEPALDLHAVARTAVRLGRLAAALAPAIESMDLNPLRVGAAGEPACAVDAVVQLKEHNHAT
ncbi:acetate--CoA ligase family protein [Orrella sp. JC864]|uniref:acetate--CoA ligase family protein n=1 Tax=Orrella sp. JC864 TaxID=3120298 RepID=UPI0030098958